MLPEDPAKPIDVPAIPSPAEVPEPAGPSIASVDETTVPLSVIEEDTGGLPAPPHFIKVFTVPAGETVSWVAEFP